jgi:LPS sulfotransferase NodH
VHWYQFQHFTRILVPQLIKSGACGNVAASPPILTDVLPNLRYVWLRRQDKVRQAVSYAKAIHTGVWWKLDGRTVEDKKSLSYADSDIETALCQIETWEREWESYFDKHRISPHLVWYERLVADYELTIINVLRYLGVPIFRDLTIAKPRLKPQADAESEKRVELFKRHSAGQAHPNI